MMGSRFTPIQQPMGIRKSRLEAKPSLLPKPRRTGSVDRLSAEVRRPSNARSSSAEPPRATIGVRFSKETSATKLPLNRRSKSQQGENRFGQAPITPVRNSHFSRGTTTPVTPSEDRSSRSWQTCLDRALAFVTIKDQRPLSSPQWLRAVSSSVSERLKAAGMGSLMRPLTITRFVDVTGHLLAHLLLCCRDHKLSNDNYVAKVPHMAKMLLYPGVVSKSWLKTVNTLHAYPQALALIAYLLDLVQRVELPVLDEWLYLEKDELDVLRRDYLYKCWLRFQEHDQFGDLNDEYLQSLKMILGNDDEKINELRMIVNKYESRLEDEEELEARREEERRAGRRAELLAELRAAKASRVSNRTMLRENAVTKEALIDQIKRLDNDNERINQELVQVCSELESQGMSLSERTRLLDEVVYASRVQDSKRALTEQLNKMILAKEEELALWQKRTLSSCVQYKQGLIHLSAHWPGINDLAIDENSLMSPSCESLVSAAVSSLRTRLAEESAALGDRGRQRVRARAQRATHMEEANTKLAEMKAELQREKEALEAETAREAREAQSWAREQADLTLKVELARGRGAEYAQVADDLALWEAQEQAWCSKLSSLSSYVKETRVAARKSLADAKHKREAIVQEKISEWHSVMDQAAITEKKAKTEKKNKK